MRSLHKSQPDDKGDLRASGFKLIPEEKLRRGLQISHDLTGESGGVGAVRRAQRRVVSPAPPPITNKSASCVESPTTMRGSFL